MHYAVQHFVELEASGKTCKMAEMVKAFMQYDIFLRPVMQRYCVEEDVCHSCASWPVSCSLVSSSGIPDTPAACQWL